MKVLVVDDLPIVLERLRELLTGVKDIDLVGVAQDAKEATELALSSNPDVVVLDISVRGGRGMDVLQAVKKANPATAVIVSTILFDPIYREACLKRGADFFFDKATEFEKIAGVLKALNLRAAPQTDSNLEANV